MSVDATSPLVLIVEDDQDIATLIEFHLSHAGYRTTIVSTGQTAMREISADPGPDLVMLDIMLPDIDGLEICRRLKNQPASADVPIIFVSARSDEADVVTGLELGADDYIAKPFNSAILLARVEAVLRRRRPSRVGPTELIQVGLLHLDRGRHVARVDGKEIDLTYTQYQILQFLAMKPGFVRTRRQIVSAIRGERAVLSGRAVDVHVAGLRKALGPQADMIETVRSVGYRLRDPAETVG